MSKKYWLMKTEPTTFSYDDLLKAPKKTTAWEGVRNYQARNLMRDQMKKGDLAILYHSSCDVPAGIGIMEISKEAYPDPFALDSKSQYFDSDAKKKGENPWVVVEVTAKKKFKTPVTRDLMKGEAKLKNVMVLKKGSRLSVQPLLESEFLAICELGNS